MGGQINQTVYNGQQEGMLYVQSAGNDYDNLGSPASCTLNGVEESPSAFVVASAGSTTLSCGTTWSTCALSGFSDRGGMNATIDGVTRTAVLSMVGLAAPGCPSFSFTTSSTILYPFSGCGTSYASPLVGAAAAHLRDWFLDQGYGSATIARLYTPLLAMGDRASDGGSPLLTSFDPRFGGGRLQLRYFNSADLAAPWGWEAFTGSMSDGTVSGHNLFGTGPEPSGIGQLKAYGFFLEDDNDNMADIDMYLDDNAGGTLTSDTSRDVKSMVRVAGASASGRDLRLRREGYHVPPGQTRDFYQFAYYSGNTTMR